MSDTLIVILGATGIGKTDLSIRLAQMLDTCIISSDSRQIYKELSIGTAVPSTEQLQAVKHYMIHNKSITDYYSAGKYELEVIDLLSKLFKEKQNILLAGGSGMYIDAVCKGIDDLPDIDPKIRQDLISKYEKEGIESLRFDLKRLDPKSYKQIDLQNYKRILKALEITIQTGKTYSSFRTESIKKRPFNILKIGLERERGELYNRINQRVDIMMQNGLEAEARKVYHLRNLNALNTVGYKELFDYFDGNITKEKAIELIKRNSRRYAKRQMTWFKRDKDIHWFHPENEAEIINFIKTQLPT